MKLLKYSVRLSPLQFICKNFSSTMSISTVILKKSTKMLKMVDFVNFEPKYLGPQMFHRHAVCEVNSKYSLISHNLSLVYLMTLTSTTQKCPNYLHLGLVGCRPAPIIFPLANEFDKGKMFWNPIYPPG